ncbi:hypothetical protein MWU58_09415 [Flavobacteriaceae bacterium S0825]|uniref:hypothetical protein n=1 Tax=Gaetbulibacter sp. S0825 TaxID=2720084 RepID=UPI001432134A|nr:hypothetical protein [Gaetbulibacter sp. S0825]MCK0109511.1 hypothetical protein [Flavobacteriaceae bacterium S0825]NIX65146.1 hypothetical protein [Gaetbulibacter sp. S0825]
MKFKKIILVTSFALLAICLSAQTNTEMSPLKKDFPTESVYVHYNSTLLFSGETLYYKFYSLNNFSNKLSNISKVGYIELIDKNKQTVFKHKIRLNNGQGLGDFLLPSDIISGNYKLIGYTAWMSNNQENKFFDADLKIINPYKSINEATIKNDSLNIKPKGEFRPNSTENFELKLQKRVYRVRDEVPFSVVSDEKLDSDISISVHKINNIKSPSLQSIKTFREEQANNVEYKTVSKEKIKVFPEIRGEIVRGTLKSGTQEVVNKKIALSIPSGGLINIIKTDSEGRFSLNVNQYYNSNELYAKVFDENTDNYNIELEPLFKIDFKEVNFEEFRIFESEVPKILERSILNQIDNAYLFTKTDSIIKKKPYLPFDKSYDLVYDLDDYNRFSDMSETFIEIINQAQIYEVSNDDFQFAILNNKGSFDKSIPPLLVIDGIIVKNANLLVNYNAKSIKTIKIIKDKYFLGSDIFNGVIVFQTINNDFSRKVGDYVLNKFELYDLEKIKHYKNVSYKGSLLTLKNKIPDYRRQLYWNARVKLSGNTNNFTFYTSDNTGEFEIRVEGFTERGEPVSLSSTFTVIEE